MVRQGHNYIYRGKCRENICKYMKPRADIKGQDGKKQNHAGKNTSHREPKPDVRNSKPNFP